MMASAAWNAIIVSKDAVDAIENHHVAGVILAEVLAHIKA
jgi:hypothetical protein